MQINTDPELISLRQQLFLVAARPCRTPDEAIKNGKEMERLHELIKKRERNIQ